MAPRHRDVLRPPITTRPDPRAEPDDPRVRDAQLACLARIALVRRRVVIEPDDRPTLTPAPPRAPHARPLAGAERGVWCFRPQGDLVEVVELPDEE